MAQAIESVDELKLWIGREVGVSGWLEITQARINQFADLSDDHQWIHVDIERALAESPFRTPIAHGFLTVALLTPLLRGAVDLRIPCKLMVNYGFNRLRFPAPVPAGSRIRAHVSVDAVREVECGIEFAWSVAVEIENHAKPALAAEWLLRLYF